MSIPFIEYPLYVLKMDDRMEEEEMLAIPSPVASPNAVCTRCPVLEKKIVLFKIKRSIGSEDQRVS